MSFFPLVSVNIPTYNSAKTLEETLKSIKNQTYPNIEIVVIDGYSKDGTIKIAQDYRCKVGYKLAVGAARKLGVEMSSGKYIFFIDSDQTINEATIEECVNECEGNSWDEITLFERSMILNNTYLERVIEYDKWVFHSLEDDDAKMGAAIPRFFKKKIFSEITWPSELFMFEHNAIYIETLKHGAKVKFRPDLNIYHYEQNTLSKYFIKFFHYGQSYFICLKKYPTYVAAHSLPRRAYFTKKAFDKPDLWVGLLVLYFIKAFAAGLGGLAYLIRGGKDERTAEMGKEQKS
jgi:glycosyltransferase involved in cell wall biosynthesis